MSMFRFGCGHLRPDPEIHDASWGARLIYSEVTSGSSGVVWDRQTPDGEPENVQRLFPVIDRALAEFRKPENQYRLDSGSRGELCWREGNALVVMSPQGSYGYLYITAVLEKINHTAETKLADFEGKIDPIEFPRLGNWPPEVVEERRQKELKNARERLEWARRELVWAEMDVRAAKTPRAAKLRQKKVDEKLAEIDQLQEKIATA